MKTTIVSDKTKTIINRTLKLKVGKFIVTESYTNSKLISQEWSIDGGFGKTHRSAYNSKDLYFQYYENIDFLISDICSNTMRFYNTLPEYSLVKDWNEFKGFNHVLSINVGIDGNIYRIDKSTPIEIWRFKDSISSFTNKKYNLLDVKKDLESKKWIRNVRIVNIPYYNCQDDETEAIEFEYKASSSKALEKLGLTIV